jgi:hypothetical protein
MAKSNLELFKQALNEAWDNKIRREVESCTEEIVTSERHKATMLAILDGTYDKSAKWKLTRTKVVAILVAAALLLASCAVIYRNEIRDLVEDIFEGFNQVTYSDEGADEDAIEDIYELSYVPEGYVLEESFEDSLIVKYKFTDCNNNVLAFEQRVLDNSKFLFDVESGYALLLNVDNINIYHKTTKAVHIYLWNDGCYSIKIRSTTPLTHEELKSIIDGITTK